jgi:hypothetical protein
MFSLRETETGKFIYRCHVCGLEHELTATDKVAAADEAVGCSETHKCAPELPPLSDTKAPRAS